MNTCKVSHVIIINVHKQHPTNVNNNKFIHVHVYMVNPVHVHVHVICTCTSAYHYNKILHQMAIFHKEEQNKDPT